MELALTLLVVPAVISTGFLLRREFRALRVEWRVRRGLRAALAQAA